MEYFSGIAGNENLKEYFSAHLRGGRLAHAYLFVGPSGSGKTNFALALAAAMACRDTVHFEDAVRRFDYGHGGRG